MEGNRYLIKATYLEGPHSGKVYFLRKEGYVTDLYQYQWEDTTYASEAIAKRVCSRLTKNNDHEVEWERRMNEAYRAKGMRTKGENDFIYWPEKYEPIRISSPYDQVDRSELTRDELISCIQDYLKYNKLNDAANKELNELLEAGQN